MNANTTTERRPPAANPNLGWILCGLLLLLVMSFVVLSLAAPEFMGMRLSDGHALTAGFVLGIVDVIVVIGTALYFEHRLNATASASTADHEQ